ncbi:MAG: sigma-54-dependent Fis family transcriptional regulator [Deltaproteobacteria bacterium]|nr:sigma-54-dependent Fis family transcriptional regulator [Deltaproteobacteria bacterium]
MPKAKVLVIDDESMIRWSVEQTLRAADYEVASAESAAEGTALFRELAPDVVFLDLRLPDGDGLTVLKSLKDEAGSEVAVIIMTAFGEIRTAVEATRLGAYDYLKKPFDFNELEVIVEKALETISLRREVGELRQERKKAYSWENIIGKSERMRQVLGLVEKVAQSDAATVLLRGENGTGKDLFARAIHYCSRRADGPFLDISCTAMPETLFESELFGYEKGAFTDAKATKRGLLELASGGTLFLDEVGDMPLVSQAKFLKFIESKQFKRLGGTVDHHVDIRIVAATNADLESAVREGRFREDLYYRLKVIPIVLPPLRERRDDIPALLHHYMAKYNAEFRKSFRKISAEALKLLVAYPWPGNVRELRNLLERILILERGDTILPEHLPPEITTPGALAGASVLPPGSDPASAAAVWPTSNTYRLPPAGISLEEVEKEFVRQSLEIAEGNQTRAAQLLGISRDALRYRMQKFGFSS